MITGEQVKAARELLGWPLQRPRRRSGARPKDPGAIRGWPMPAHGAARRGLRDVLQVAGVEFTPPGVKLKAKARTVAAGDLNASNDE
jgi:hypothetical protein